MEEKQFHFFQIEILLQNSPSKISRFELNKKKIDSNKVHTHKQNKNNLEWLGSKDLMSRMSIRKQHIFVKQTEKPGGMVRGGGESKTRIFKKKTENENEVCKTQQL